MNSVGDSGGKSFMPSDCFFDLLRCRAVVLCQIRHLFPRHEPRCNGLSTYSKSGQAWLPEIDGRIQNDGLLAFPAKPWEKLICIAIVSVDQLLQAFRNDFPVYQLPAFRKRHEFVVNLQEQIAAVMIEITVSQKMKIPAHPPKMFHSDAKPLQRNPVALPNRQQDVRLN